MRDRTRGHSDVVLNPLRPNSSVRRLALVTWLTIASLLVLPLALMPGETRAAQTPTSADIECPITIGAAVHLTGPVATYDAPPVQGAELAVQEINEQGGVLGCDLRLIKTDGRSDIAGVGDAAVAAIQEGAQVLIAPCDFDYGAPVSQVAQENGIVGISECASSPLYNSHILGDMQFTMSNWANANAAASAEHACIEKGWTRGIAVIDSFTSFTELLGEYWVDAYDHHGCTVVETLAYTKGEMTFAAQTQRLQELAGEYDVILITADMPDVSVMIRALRSAGIATPIVGAGNMDTGEFFKALGPEAGDEIYVTSLYWMGPETGEDMVHFLQAFQEMHGREADNGLYVMGYNLINVLAQAIEKAGTVDGPALADALEGTEFDIVGGTLSWTDAADGHLPQAPQFMVVQRKGELVYEGPIKATYVPVAEEAVAPE
jgi:branched-chain amino acid transport system substrate-binding protein